MPISKSLAALLRPVACDPKAPRARRVARPKPHSVFPIALVTDSSVEATNPRDGASNPARVLEPLGAREGDSEHAGASARVQRTWYDRFMSSVAPNRFTESEFLALERGSDRKHEFVDGVIVAMAGARPAHNILAANVTASLVLLARGRACATMTSDQRVYVPTTRLYCYPDVIVACGERRYDDGDPPSLLNPTILVEVTSESTEDFDRGTKFLHYQAIAELREYVIVSHRERRIDLFRREGDGQWHLTTLTKHGSSVDLAALGGAISLSEVYNGVSLEEGLSTNR